MSGKKNARSFEEEVFGEDDIDEENDQPKKKKASKAQVSIPAKTANEIIMICSAYVDGNEAVLTDEVSTKMRDAIRAKLTAEKTMDKIPLILEQIKKKRPESEDLTDLKAYINRALQNRESEQAQELVREFSLSSRSALLSHKKDFLRYIDVIDYYLTKLNPEMLAVKFLPKIMNKMYFDFMNDSIEQDEDNMSPLPNSRMKTTSTFSLLSSSSRSQPRPAMPAPRVQNPSLTTDDDNEEEE